MAKILVVDDELGIRELLSEILNDEGHTVDTAQDATQARQLLPSLAPDLVLLDIWMPDTDGVTLLKEWASGGQLTMPVIMMSGHATIDTAVEATKIGAVAFLEKPITLQKLLKAVDQALHPARTVQPVALPDAPHAVAAVAPVPGPTPASLNSTLPPTGMPVPMTDQVPADAAVQPFHLDKPLREARDDFERAYFEYHLGHENGSMTRVAEKTGLERTHLYRKLKQLGIDLSRQKRTNQN